MIFKIATIVVDAVWLVLLAITAFTAGKQSKSWNFFFCFLACTILLNLIEVCK